MNTIENAKEIISSYKRDDGKKLRIMEVCGTHTHEIFRLGIRKLLPESVELISGPGCPVCVTPIGFIDEACMLALEKGAVICTFGDLIRVPGTEMSLAGARSKGAVIKTVYSPLDAVSYAESHPDEQVVFLAVGFETTTPSACLAVEKAKKFHSARNMSYSQGNRMGKRSVDCSSFCGRCYLPQGITMGGSTSWCNTAAGMALWSTKKGKVVANSGVSIGKKKLLPGDLVFYKKGYNGRYKNIYHVEIFVGYEWRNNQLVGYTMSSITGNYPSILKRDYTSRKGRVAQIARPAQ